MSDSYWHKQTTDKPLFPDLLWSRPENRNQAGKLLIIGGSLSGFAAVGEAYVAAVKAGAGSIRILLPDSIKKHFPHIHDQALEAVEWAANTPSGSFAQKALDELLACGRWADGVLVAGDLGRNSETAILLEKFAAKYPGQLTLTKDAADYFIATPSQILHRPDTTLVITLAQLQKLAMHANFPKPFTSSMDLLHLVETLHDFTAHYPVNVVVNHLDTLFAATNGQVSTTKQPRQPKDREAWQAVTAAHTSVWQLQNPAKPFEALTTAIYEMARL